MVKPKKIKKEKREFDVKGAAKMALADAFAAIKQMAINGKSEIAKIESAKYLIEAAGVNLQESEDIVADIAFIEIERRDGKIYELPPLKIVPDNKQAEVQAEKQA